MKEITVGSGSSTISLGKQGEKGVTVVKFNVSNYISDYTITLYHKRSEDDYPYQVPVEISGNYAVWTVSSDDTYYSGDGKAELRFSKDETLEKSIIFRTNVIKSLSEKTTEKASNAFVHWYERIASLIDGIKAAVTSVNSKTGDVTLTASDVNALPDTTAIPTKTSELTNDSGYLTSESDPTVPSWAKQTTKPSYTASEVGALPSSTVIPSKTSQLENDSEFATKSELSDYVAKESQAAKTDSMTQAVGIDSNGKLWTAPGSGGSATVDSALSATSTNPVQNKVINEALGKKYEKPSTGIPASDIANGVIPDETTVEQVLTSGTEIAQINGTSIFAPEGGGSSSYTLTETYNIDEEVSSFTQTLTSSVISAINSAKSVKIVMYLSSPSASQSAAGSLVAWFYKQWNRTNIFNYSSGGTPANATGYDCRRFAVAEYSTDGIIRNTGYSNFGFPMMKNNMMSIQNGSNTYALSAMSFSTLPDDCQIVITTSTVIGAGSYIKIYTK